MDKRSILAVVLIFLLLYVYQTFFIPAPLPPQATGPIPAGAPVTAPTAVPAPLPKETSSHRQPPEEHLPAPDAAAITVPTAMPPLAVQHLAVTDAVWSWDRHRGLVGWNLPAFKKDADSSAPVEFFGLDEKEPGFRFWAGKPNAGGVYARENHRLVSTKGSVPLMLEAKARYGFDLAATRAAPFRIVVTKRYPAQGRIGRAYGSTGLVFVEHGEVQHKKLKDLVEDGFTISSSVSWVGIEGKYFLLLFHTEGMRIDVRVTATENEEEKSHRLDLAMTVLPVAAPDGTGVRLDGYLGPKDGSLLKELSPELGTLIDFGWFSVIARPMLAIMHLFYDWFGNWGLSIILLTVLIKTLLFPMQLRFTESMYRMQALKPKMEKLKEKFKDDKMRLNQEMANLYKQEGVNPLGGCLPMFIQLPIFIALYNVLYTAIELRQAPFFGWINDLSQADLFFQVTIGSFALPIRLLPLLMAVTSYIQTRLTPTSVDNEQQRMMMTWMPIIFTFLFYSLPSGLMLYWLTQNLITILQNLQIKRRMIARGLLQP